MLTILNLQTCQTLTNCSQHKKLLCFLHLLILLTPFGFKKSLSIQYKYTPKAHATQNRLSCKTKCGAVSIFVSWGLSNQSAKPQVQPSGLKPIRVALPKSHNLHFERCHEHNCQCGGPKSLCRQACRCMIQRSMARKLSTCLQDVWRLCTHDTEAAAKAQGTRQKNGH